MSDDSSFTLVIQTEDANILAIETSFIDNIGVVEIERFDIPSVNIYTGIGTLSIADIPDIPVSKITGLDDYLDAFAETINVDGGDP